MLNVIDVDGQEPLGCDPTRVGRRVEVVEADAPGVDDEVRTSTAWRTAGDEAAPE